MYLIMGSFPFLRFFFLILYRRFLFADLNFAFSALAENGGVARAAPNLSSISQIVTVYEKIRTHFSANF